MLLDKYAKGEKNLPSFREHVLVNPDDEQCPSAPFHYHWSDVLLLKTENFCIEGYRESAKTQIILRSFPLYNLVYPNELRRYVLFVCRNQEMAEKRLKAVKEEYKGNPLLKVRMNNIQEDSASTFQLGVYDNDGKVILVRYEAHGKAGSIRGASWGALRPQLVVMDDLQNKDDMDSERALERDWDWFLDDVLPLTSKGRIFYISNNMGEKCIAERIFACNGDFGPSKKFLCSRVPKTTSLSAHGIPAWTTRDNQTDILAERDAYARVGRASIWMRNNMCECVAQEDKVFNPEWFRYYHPSDIENIIKSCNVFARGDLGLTSKDTGDYTAFVVVGVNEMNYWYVLDCIYGHLTLDERVDAIFDINRKWNPMNFGIENAAGADLLIRECTKQMPVRNNWIRKLFECTHGGKKKELRIEAMQPRFAANAVWFPEDAAWLPEMISELSMFTRLGLTTLHDDLIDALAYMEQDSYPPVNPRKAIKHSRDVYKRGRITQGAKCRIG